MTDQNRPESPVDAGTTAVDDRRFDDRGLPAGRTIDKDWEIGPRDVHRRVFKVGIGGKVRDGDVLPLLLDCRTTQEAELAQIEGSLLIPMHDVHARLGELEAYRETPIIVYCHHGNRSLQVVATLRELGFEDARSMAGGIDLWSQSVDASVPRY